MPAVLLLQRVHKEPDQDLETTKFRPDKAETPPPFLTHSMYFNISSSPFLFIPLPKSQCHFHSCLGSKMQATWLLLKTLPLPPVMTLLVQELGQPPKSRLPSSSTQLESKVDPLVVVMRDVMAASQRETYVADMMMPPSNAVRGRLSRSSLHP